MESRLSSDRLGPVETLRIDYRHRRKIGRAHV